MFKLCRILGLSLFLLAIAGCGRPSPADRTLTAELPLHLEEHLDSASIYGSEVPKDVPEDAVWRFDEGIQGWTGAVLLLDQPKAPLTTHAGDALRLTLTKENRNRFGFRVGAAYVGLPGWKPDDWGTVVVRARTADPFSYLTFAYDLRLKPGQTPGEGTRFLYYGTDATLIRDGAIHTYLLRPGPDWPADGKGPWKELGIIVGSHEKEADDSRKGPISIDILSVEVVPVEKAYAESRAGTSSESWDKVTHRALYTHVPGTIAYRVKVPAGGRLDFGFGLLKKDSPVKLRVSASRGAADAKPEALLEETYSGKTAGIQRSVDLSSLAGETVTLALETEAERPGNVAFWAAPTLSGRRTTALPNIVFYVIDGAAADFMSVYGYNRRTTPNLERLAAEGALFENAYSNSSWTKVSVPSFMTSLHGSVLGGFLSISDPVPAKAVTMAERMHRASYVTEVLTSNPYCGRASNLDRGVDSMVDTEPDYNRAEYVSSADLHREYWRLREAQPGEPYWVHFQPTDVHMPWKQAVPFAGLFSTADERRVFEEMRKKMRGLTGQSLEEVFDKSGIDQALYFEIARKLYDESMAHQDHTIGQLVARLKERGEWENTLFIVTSDHSHRGAALPLLDARRPKYDAPLLAAHHSRIPMVFVWPEKIAPGRRFPQPVSLIDMLPTILDLAGLPPAEICQGRSLAPLLLGKQGWTPRPVVFDEFIVDDTSMYGSVEVVDGRWGASLRIDPRPDDKKTPRQRARPAPLLVFDVWEDPQAFKSLHAERPDLVEKYSKMLEAIWKGHQALAKEFNRSGDTALTAEQIETLRSLGYIR